MSYVTCGKVALAAQSRMIWSRPKAKIEVRPVRRPLASSRIQERNYKSPKKGMAVQFQRNIHATHLEGIIKETDDTTICNNLLVDNNNG